MDDIIKNVNYYAFYLADILYDRNHIDKILDHLYIGNIYAALNNDIINEHNITVVMNCSVSIPFDESIKYKYRLSILDNETDEEIEKMTLGMDKYIDIIHTHIQNNENVLVHCKAGVQRSATIVVGYLMKYLGFELTEAIKTLKNIRPCVMQSYPHFISSLNEYGKKISLKI